jgi:hypothetical protein
VRHLKLQGGLVFAIVFSTTNLACLAQGPVDQTIFQDEKQMLNTDSQQLQQLDQEKQEYKQEVQAEEQKDEPYRLYAQKRVQELGKLRAAGGSPVRSLSSQSSKELYALQSWLQADSKTQLEERQRLQQLDQAIANLQTQETQTMSNMQSAIHGLQNDATQSAEDKRFQQEMQINQFNEEQSEMGWISKQGRPRDLYGWGYYNSPLSRGWGGRSYY